MTRWSLAFLIIWGCSSKGHLQGHLTGEQVPCGFDNVGCRVALDAFFKSNPDVRIAGIDAVYKHTMDLVVWTTENSGWPRANELSVSEVPCVRSADGPDCLSPIDSLWIGPARDNHAFLVPLFSERNHELGSWSFLDVQTKDASSPRPEHVVEVPCRLEKGAPWLNDPAGNGVMTATDLGPIETNEIEPTQCEPALMLYLRTNPDLHIRSVVSEDGKSGTRSLLVLTGPSSDRSPRARDLAVGSLACANEDCPSFFISLRNAPSLSRSLFSVPIGTHRDSPQVSELLIVSSIK
jgi:hypothetical protein